MPPRALPTHFLCIPLASPQLAANLAAFRAATTRPPFNLPPAALRPPSTLHLTLGVMTLTPDTARAAALLLRTLDARAILDDARAACAGPIPTPDAAGGLAVNIEGLRAMQPAHEAAVLYAPPADAHGVLAEFARRLRGVFFASGLMADDGRGLLLHATLVNTVYVRGGRGRGRGRVTVDARAVLARWGEHVWAEEVPLTRVAICRMGARAIPGTDDAAYEVEAEIAL